MADGHEFSRSPQLENFHSHDICNTNKNQKAKSLCKEGSDFLWTSDLSDLKQFVEKVLNLRGKWSSPGGETKQFVSDEIIIKWYGPTKKKIVLVADNKENFLQNSLQSLVCENLYTEDGNFEDNIQSYCERRTQQTRQRVSSCQTDSILEECADDGLSGLVNADIEGLKLEVSIVQSQLNSTNSLVTQNQNGFNCDLSITINKQKELIGIVKHQDEQIHMLKRENQMDKEKLSTLENTLFEQQEIICILKEQNLTIKSKLLSIENILSMQSCQSQGCSFNEPNKTKDDGLSQHFVKNPDALNNSPTISANPLINSIESPQIDDVEKCKTHSLSTNTTNSNFNTNNNSAGSDSINPIVICDSISTRNSTTQTDITVNKSINSQPSTSKSKIQCPFISRRGGCLKGNRCDYYHPNRINSFKHRQTFNAPKNEVPCPFLRKKGFCKKGITCDFSHNSQIHIMTDDHSRPNPSSNDWSSFLGNLQKSMEKIETRLSKIEVAQTPYPQIQFPSPTVPQPPNSVNYPPTQPPWSIAQRTYPKPLMEIPFFYDSATRQ